MTRSSDATSTPYAVRLLGEPGRGRNKVVGSYRQPWYPVVEYHGLVFAYLGPAERQPVFPRYDIFEDLGDDEEIVVVDHFAFGTSSSSTTRSAAISSTSGSRSGPRSPGNANCGASPPHRTAFCPTARRCTA
ncbi:MAG: hypothetical protein M3Q72_00290 [Actinomycetota bacterium]|nr:hypothetical protein [Actinomycetota bacterium]